MKIRNSLVIALIGVVFAAVISSGCGAPANSATPNPANSEPPVVEVSTAQAMIQPIPSYIEATGSLASDAQSDVAPSISGKVVEVNFDVGSYVNEGEILIRLDARDAEIRLQQARAQLEQAKRSAEQAEANVSQASANLEQVKAKLGVSDHTTFRIKDFAQVKSVTAQLELAEHELRRAEKLLESGDISRAIYDQRRSQRDSLLGLLDDARANASVALKAVTTAEAAVQATRAAANSANAAVGAAEAQVRQAEKTLSDNVVRSPLSGYIAEKSIEVGEYISPNTPNTKIATIVKTSTLRLMIDIPEQNVGRVATGQSVSLQTSAYPDRNFAGRIVRISPSLNQQARTLTVEAEVVNSEGLLKPGQFATVRITQSKPEPAVMIPVAAIRTDGTINRVFVIRDGAAREQIVQLGLLENEMIQVKNGVVEGDIVATSNLNLLSDGVLVRQ